jgi:hypothetical protein
MKFVFMVNVNVSQTIGLKIMNVYILSARMIANVRPMIRNENAIQTVNVFVRDFQVKMTLTKDVKVFVL